LYKYSHEKFQQLCEKPGMRVIFEHFETQGKMQYKGDKDMAKALQIVRDTML